MDCRPSVKKVMTVTNMCVVIAALVVLLSHVASADPPEPESTVNATYVDPSSTKPIKPPRTTKTSIRNRKMRGEDNLSGSSSFAIRSILIRAASGIRRHYDTDGRQLKNRKRERA